MAFTKNFNLEKPALGDYFGSWNTPINLNMDAIDGYLLDIKNNYINKAQSSITTKGQTWYDTARNVLSLYNGTALLDIMTSDSFIMSLNQQQQLISYGAGTPTLTNLHCHPGIISQFFIVRDPSEASTSSELAAKPTYAIPYSLYSSNKLSTDANAAEIRSDLTSLQNKVALISTNGIDIHINAVSASGDINVNGNVISKQALKTAIGTSGTTLTIGGGTSTTETEVISTGLLPINFKSTATGTLELQVQGNKIWHAGNQGAGTGMDSDSVDKCNVDDTGISTTTLWTSKKTNDVISAEHTAMQSAVDAEHTAMQLAVSAEHIAMQSTIDATNQTIAVHKTSSDHDSRYVKATDFAATSSAGVIKVGGGLNIDGNGILSTSISNISLDSTPYTQKAYITGKPTGEKKLAPEADIVIGKMLKIVFGTQTVYVPGTQTLDLSYCACTCTCTGPCNCCNGSGTW